MEATMVLLVAMFAMLSVSVSGFPNANYPVLCSKLKPVPGLQLSELEGSWLTVESLLLRDGFPESPSAPHRPVCVRSIVSDASDAGMSISSEVHLGSKKRRTGRTKFQVNDPDEPGRWNMLSRRPSGLTSEMLAIAARPSQYLVLAFCQPTSSENEDEGDRPALWVKILARPGSRGFGGNSLNVNKRELTALREKIREMLGLKEMNSVHFDISC